jgi:hypothetical protein
MNSAMLSGGAPDFKSESTMPRRKSPLARASNYRPEGIGEWLRLPKMVQAPSPDDRCVICLYRLATDDIIKLALAGRREVNFECWAMVFGSPPPVPGCNHRNRHIPGKLISLVDAHALFQGIERPLGGDDDGCNILAYISKPRFFYEYDPDMVSVVKKSALPDDVVFVVYVRLDAPGAHAITRGVITHWHFVESDKDRRDLPANYATRYRTQRW